MILLDCIDPGECLELVVLISLLCFVGEQMSTARSEPWARRIAGAGFITYGILGIAAWEPASAGECVAIAFRALLFCGVVLGLAKIAAPAAIYVWDNTGARYLAAVKRRRELQRQQEEQEAKRQAEELAAQLEREEQERRAAEIANRPPPPTPEARAAAAKQRYEARLDVIENSGMDELERNAAQEKAKQQYLQELDQTIA